MTKNINSISVSAPGKLHLIGEHAVVYGKPAIIAAVNRRCYISISYSKFANRLRHAQAKNFSMSKCQRVERTDKSRYVDSCLRKSFDFFNMSAFAPDGSRMDFSEMDIKSDIPLGSGMGSSAALAVAIAGLMTKFATGKLDKEKINTIAFDCEKYMHANPSGGDNTASTYGGFIWYQKSAKIIKHLPYLISQKISSHFLIINTGRPEETTGEMISKVKNQRSKTKNSDDKIFDQQGKLTYQLLTALKNENSQVIKEIIKQAEENLESLGVVSESTKKFIRKIEKSGGSAKICGAGGIKGASGIVLVWSDDYSKIQAIAKEYNLIAEEVMFGEEGVRVEKSPN